MKEAKQSTIPERSAYTKYYEHDGLLRAYANRMLWFGICASATTVMLTILFFSVKVQPPTVIRVSASGETSVVGATARGPVNPLGLLTALAVGKSPDEAPTDIEGRAVVRRFLERYLTYTQSTVDQQWADALNMMTTNLRTATINQLRDQDTISKIREDDITSGFRIRSIAPVKGQPWTYTAFGVKEVHRVHSHTESTDRLVTRYDIRLLQTDRTERTPSGLLVAEYGEHQMVGERENGLDQASALTEQ